MGDPKTRAFNFLFFLIVGRFRGIPHKKRPYHGDRLYIMEYNGALNQQSLGNRSKAMEPTARLQHGIHGKWIVGSPPVDRS